MYGGSRFLKINRIGSSFVLDQPKVCKVNIKTITGW